MGIYYSAVDFDEKKVINPPGNFSCKFPGLFHPDNPFSHLVILMNSKGYSFTIVQEFYESGYEDITDEVYKEYISIFNRPERSKREDSTYDKEKDDEMGQHYLKNIKIVEMRCSEHCGNTVRDK